MQIRDEILRLKKEKNAVILAHCYQNIEIDEVADFVGDSLYLSQMAAKTDADIIVFAGVYFMAQTAKIISPNKKIFLPNMNSGCLMADMVDLNQLRDFKSKHKNIPVVCYINSTAEVKSECDICVTSSNAIKVVKSLNAPEILFLPDTYLGKYVESQLKNVKVTTYPGFCPTHIKITEDDVKKARENHPNALILTHPECHKNVCELSDFVGSTSQIIKYAGESTNNEFVIATEKGVAERLKRDFPQKTFYLIKDDIVCPNMKCNTLDDIYNVLKNEINEIMVDENISKKALKSISKMLEVCK
ncbi:quinolinate synthase NadA [bacterium]|nr:quinolinate synthase NadA [bacterium]